LAATAAQPVVETGTPYTAASTDIRSQVTSVVATGNALIGVIAYWYVEVLG
jgi:hypothetical protein